MIGFDRLTGAPAPSRLEALCELSARCEHGIERARIMYTPSHFLETDLTRLDWLAAQNSFGTLISPVRSAPFASHLPVLYDREGVRVTLTGHWTRPNPQWKSVSGQRALFTFHGPHAYISPRWYGKPKQHVPTWDYAVAHVYGSIRVIEDPHELATIVARLAVRFESGASDPWKFEESTGPELLRGIVGFELISDAIEVKFKLNQNHSTENVTGAIARAALIERCRGPLADRRG